MKPPDAFSEFIDKYPRQTLQIVTVTIFLIWQTFATLLGFAIYVVFKCFFKSKEWWLFGFGLFVAITALLFQQNFFSSHQSWSNAFLKEGFSTNISMMLLTIHGNLFAAFQDILREDFYYFFGTSLFFSGVLSAIDLIPNSAHEKALFALKDAKLSAANQINAKQLKKRLEKMQETAKGVSLGVSKKTGAQVVVPHAYVNQIVLILGTTGGGKTVTLQRFYTYAAKYHWPLLIVDGKPTNENIEKVRQLG